MTEFPKNTTNALLPGPAGSLEIITTWPKNLKREAVAIICHPHPLYQGTMKNKVVTTLFRAFDHWGIPAIRFNFRGVGKSDGEYGEVVGEQEDLMAILDWVSKTLIDYDVYLAGFSFGSYIAASVANKEPVSGLISVAPPVHHNAFNKLSNIKCPWLIAMGDADEIVPCKDVVQFVETSPRKQTFKIFPGVGHFFHGELKALEDTVLQWLG